jgi:peptide/nickel transport system substrate-binding protein
MGWDADYQLNLRSLFHTSAIEGPYQLASYSNPEVDRILDTAPLERDREAARGDWRRFQEIMRRDQPWTFLWYAPDLFVVRDRARDVHMDIRGPFATLNRWWIFSGPAVAR